MIDRKARDRMAAALRSYMAEEITAFQLDEKLTEITDATEDKTAKEIGLILWFFYDDLKDHKVVASKEAWSLFNRLLLFLESDEEIEVVKGRRQWHYRQAIAAAFLVGFVFIAFKAGLGEHLFAYAVPFGLVSMFLAWLDSRHGQKAASVVEVETAPFPSASNLLSVRRQVTGFSRMRYPKAIAGRRVRSSVIAKIMWLPAIMAWLMLSPAVLFFQMLPKRETRLKVKTPEPQPASGSAHGATSVSNRNPPPPHSSS